MGDPVYSPTSTEVWDTCPVLWKESYLNGWVPAEITTAEVAKVAGVLFAEAMAAHHKGQEIDLEARCQALKEEALTGRRFDRFELGPLFGTLVQEVAACGKKTVEYEAEHVLPEWQVAGVEETKADWGRARADVVFVDHRTREVIVTDYKLSLNLDNRWVAKRLERALQSQQAYHYAAAWQAQVFRVVLVRANPKPIKVWEASRRFKAWDVERWLEGQRAKWATMRAMEEGRTPAWMAARHETVYGVCPLTEWCLEYGGEPEMRETAGLVKVERSRHEG